MIDRSFDCRHAGTHVHRLSRDRILIVAAKNVVIAIRQIQPAEMTIAVNADVANVDRVRPHVADQSRPHQKSVAIEFAAVPIVVVKRARLNRVTLLDEVLAKNIRNVNILLPPIESIQTAVRVLLELREVSRVELISIIVERTEYARAEIVVRKYEAAKIGDKRLNADARGNEIEILVNVRQLHFGKRFFQRKRR